MSDEIPDWPEMPVKNGGKWNNWALKGGKWVKWGFDFEPENSEVVKTKVLVIAGKEHTWAMYLTGYGYRARRKVKKLDPLEALARLGE